MIGVFPYTIRNFHSILAIVAEPIEAVLLDFSGACVLDQRGIFVFPGLEKHILVKQGYFVSNNIPDGLRDTAVLLILYHLEPPPERTKHHIPTQANNDHDEHIGHKLGKTVSDYLH